MAQSASPPSDRPAGSAKVAAPTVAWQRALLLVGSFGPLGWMPASGTVTVAVIGIPAYWLLAGSRAWVWITAIVVLTAVSVWIHEVGDRLLGEKDSRKLVWDEVVGYLVAVALFQWSWRAACVAFVLERVLDIAKVPPANTIERKWPGGWGVVGDDIIAGFYTRTILALVIAWRPGWVGF